MITEDEWEAQFGWLPDEQGDCALINDRALVAELDPHFVWSQVDGGPHDEGLIVSGCLAHANGWYRSKRPWVTPVVVLMDDAF